MALQLIQETERRPSQKAWNELGKLYYQIDFFEEAERCFAEAERLSAVTPAA